MNTWKYRRHHGKAGYRAKDDKRFLATHHLDVPGKAHAKQCKASCKALKQDIYTPGKQLIFSNMGPGSVKWVKSRAWLMKKEHQTNA